MIRLLCLVVGYFFGAFQTAYFYGKMHGIDIRTMGSGNAGTTNTLRVLGTKAGMLVLAGDVIKTVLAILVVRFLVLPNFVVGDREYLYVLYTAAGAILGHNFPFYMQFKGGKGIASTFGLIFSFHPLFIPVGFVLFLGTFMTTHYVSLGSLLIYAGFVIQMIIMGQTGAMGDISQSVLNEMYLISILLLAMAYWKHRENIKRLLTGTERKTYLFKKNKVE
ncbi:MAG: glycerol-3-phosphate 1-O-acyltransferase PlsY [Lachnospiraceae bacterium]|nr:glycerol-3-phosphate 1-O-acyltransferase PlsY [Lachnospiraceae bacterium]